MWESCPELTSASTLGLWVTLEEAPALAGVNAPPRPWGTFPTLPSLVHVPCFLLPGPQGERKPCSHSLSPTLQPSQEEQDPRRAESARPVLSWWGC